MNREMRERLQEAGKYQKMALQALIPEKSRAHVEVIERELKAIFMECVMDAAAEMMKKEAGRWSAAEENEGMVYGDGGSRKESSQKERSQNGERSGAGKAEKVIIE